jgi:hypothetical protein
VRNLKENNSRWGEFTTHKSQNVVALFIQLSGAESHERCTACAQQNGIWAECVVSSDDQVRRSTKGSCANCYYNGLASRCSFRTDSSGLYLFLPTYLHIVKYLDFLVFVRPDSLNNTIPECSDYLAYDDTMLDMHEKIYREDLERIYGKLIVVKHLFLDPSEEVIDFFKKWIPDLGRDVSFDALSYEKVLNSQIRDYERKLFGLYLARKHR